ncbi:MAG: hypothetical protein JXR19_09830 [Bacteroidia bacterium]
MTVKDDSKNKKSKIYLFIIILVLFLINLLLIYNLVTNNKKLSLTKNELVNTQTELATIEDLKEQLEEDLDFYKGENASLDSVITLREAEIQKQVAKIKTLLSKEGVTAAELQRARSEITRLRADMERLTFEVDSLSQENQYLKDENYIMQKQVEAGQQRIQEVEAENTDLSSQVAIGKRIFLKSLEVTPMKKALGGKLKPTDKLKRVVQVDINLVLGSNDLAEKGEKTLYFKLQTPNKSTLVDESLGAGTFSYQGGESMYTLKKVVNFQNKNESALVIIPANESMTAGEYTLKVFSDTHEMASTKFILR